MRARVCASPCSRGIFGVIAGLLEKVKLKRALTHREQRKFERLNKLSRNPVTRGGKESGKQEVRSAQELRRNAKRVTRHKTQHDPKQRQSESKKAKDKFMAKRRQQAASRGAMTRAKVIIRHKKKR